MDIRNMYNDLNLLFDQLEEWGRDELIYAIIDYILDGRWQ